MLPKWMIVDLLLMIQVQILNSLTVLLLRAFFFVRFLFTPHSFPLGQKFIHYTNAHTCGIMWCPFISFYLFLLFSLLFLLSAYTRISFVDSTIFALLLHSLLKCVPTCTFLCPSPDGCHPTKRLLFLAHSAKIYYFHPAQGGIKKKDDS